MPLQASLLNRLKVQLKMAIQRLRMLQQKATAIAKQQRRQMAELLSEGKLESARIRVENIIRSDISTELHEILELYCELLLARIQLLEGPLLIPGKKAEDQKPDAVELDSGLDEAVRSLLFAAPRTEIKELQTARLLLIDKFGKEYALLAAEGIGVHERVLKRVRVETPKAELVDAYLRAIGSTYGIKFPGDPNTDTDDDDDDVDDGLRAADQSQHGSGDGHGGSKARAMEAPLEADELTRATPPRHLGATRSPLSIVPASPSTENPGVKLKLPGEYAPKTSQKASLGRTSTTQTSSNSSSSSQSPSTATINASTTSSLAISTTKTKNKVGTGPGGKIPNIDELANRFAALKRA